MKDYVRVFHPTADQEWQNRRVSEQPAVMSAHAALFCWAFIVGALMGATITLLIGG